MKDYFEEREKKKLMKIEKLAKQLEIQLRDHEENLKEISLKRQDWPFSPDFFIKVLGVLDL